MNPQSAVAAIDFLGVQVFAERNGNRVTGRVEFPPIFSRPPVPLSYERSDKPPALSSSASIRANPRLRAVQSYQAALRDPRGRSRTAIADQVAAEAGVNRRTIQLWSRKFEIEGEEALLDHYTPPPARKVICATTVAADAVLVCAWWSFRIANVAAIDSPMVAQAAALLDRFSKTDVLAGIDCYFAWPCDRTHFRFKRFSKWAQYHFAEWFFRARDDANYRDQATASKQTPAPLQLPVPSRDREGAVPLRVDPRRSAANRRRLATRATRQAIANLDANPSRDSHGAAHHPPLPRGDRGGSQSATAPTIMDALADLSDSYRAMLLAAARGDTGCREEAIATLSIWWPHFPESLRHNIEARVEGWHRDHPRATRRVLAARQVDMFLVTLRRSRRAPRLAVSVIRSSPTTRSVLRNVVIRQR